MERVKEQFEKVAVGEQVVVGCFVLQCRDPAHLLELLRQAFANLPDRVSAGPVLLETAPQEPEPTDEWLSHSAAAVYLGISKSTLYKYASQQRIECRKLGGRLNYRRSVLDRFKEQQIRPARRREHRSIITSAHNSGK